MGKIFPILIRWLNLTVGTSRAADKHKVDVVEFAGLRVDPEHVGGKTIEEMEMATQAICNGSWGSPEILEVLIKDGSMQGLLAVLARMHPVYRCVSI